jgi:hypothetical protein
MAGTPEEISMIEPLSHVVTTTIADVVVDHTERRRKFVGGVREAADQNRGGTRRPSEP